MFSESNRKLFGKTSFVIDKLCLMQHHGTPTRLLDWSENILFALFFAVEKEKNDEKDSFIYMLNAPRLNSVVEKDDNVNEIFEPSHYQVALRANLVRSDNIVTNLLKSIEELSISEKDFFIREISENYNALFLFYKVQFEKNGSFLGNYLEVFKKYLDVSKNISIEDLCQNFEGFIKFRDYLSKPVAFSPIYNHKRMFSQQSAFTIYGGAIEKSEDWRINKPTSIQEINDELDDDDKILKKIKIDKVFKKEIRQALSVLGIHRGSIYQDEFNQSNQIKEFWDRSNSL